MHLNRRARIFGTVTSLLVHGALFAYIAWRSSTPDLGFDFQLPVEVEFGLSEAVLTTASAPSPPPPEPDLTATAAGAGAGALDAGVPTPDAGVQDAGPEERPRKRDAGPPTEDEREQGASEEQRGERRGVAFLPAGSQIALRLDIARVRASPLAPDVKRILSVIPEWQALLDGSGIDPLEDLDRLLIASPNLQRSRLIAAGRATGDEAAIRGAAERMAAARGESLEWRSVRGAPLSDWHDRDPTPRVIALVGPRHFVISREVDIPRVLAVAGARAGRDRTPGPNRERDAEPRSGEEGAEPRDGSEPRGEDAPARRPRQRRHPADALLSMEAGEGLSLEVEGFRNFAAARPQQRVPIERLPIRLRIGLVELAGGKVGVRIVGEFEDAEKAEDAREHWEPIRQAYARNGLVRAMGYDALLSRMQTSIEGSELRVQVDVELSRMRSLLGLLHAFFADRAAR